jgi:NSS family neurotransmitter:Na+ symporter
MAIAREQFNSRIGFILAAAGSAVGIGNLVGFPVNAAKNGGAAFLVIYALFVVLVCLPVMLAELAAGRHTQKNPLGAYNQLSNNSSSAGFSFWSLGGWLALITPYMIAVFYAVITLWVLGYFIATVSGDLDQLAHDDYFSNFINSKSIFVYLAAVSIIVSAILYGGVKNGIERAAKIMMPMLFIMLLCLVAFVLTQDNAMLGVKFYLIPDFSKITPQVINGAMAQAFFSLSLGMGILITYGSYMKRTSSIAFSAKMVALTDTAVAFTAGLMVLPAIFSFNPDINPDELSNSSISLIFGFLPKIFIAMQTTIGYFGASVFASIFFLLVLFAALTSLVSITEVPISAVMDEKKTSRKKAVLIIGATAGLIALACSVSFGMVDSLTNFTSYGGQTKSLFDVIIDVFYDTILPLNGFLICMLVSYRWKKANFDKELELGDPDYKGSLLERYVNVSLTTFIPVILLLIFINTVLLKFFGISII